MSQMADGLMQNDFLCVVYCLPQGYFVGHRVSELVTVTWSVKKSLAAVQHEPKGKTCRFTGQFPYFQEKDERDV